MSLNPKIIESIIFKGYDSNLRFTQDSPVYPDVWLEYFRNESNLTAFRVDLILTPHRDASAAELFIRLSEKLRQGSKQLSL